MWNLEESAMHSEKSRPAHRLLRSLLDRSDHDTLLGDIEEMYALLKKREGVTAARLWYGLQVLRLLPASLRHIIRWKTYMTANYLKVTLRTIKRQKAFSFINISGLAIGLACCIIIGFYILSELSYDRYHARADRIHRICSSLKIGDRPLEIPKASPIIAQTLEKEYPEVEHMVFLDRRGDTMVSHQDIRFQEAGIINATKDLFKVFSFPLIKGDPGTALAQPGSVVLSESTARRYFGEEDPLNRVLRFDSRTDFVITGVAYDVPPNSHFTFDMVCSYDMQRFQTRKGLGAWAYINFYTYLLIGEDADPGLFEQKLPGFVEGYIGEILKTIGAEMTLSLQPLTSIHLHTRLPQDISANGSILYVRIFSAAALIILLVACLNFMNLSTARSGMRVREVGVRKVLGADRRRMVAQFLGESLFFSLFALILSLALVEVLLPVFNSLSGMALRRTYFDPPWFAIALLGLSFAVGLAAGSYPAFLLSSFPPGRVLSGRLRAGASGSHFRRSLVTVQFSLSVILIIASLLVFRQLHYMKNKDLGFVKDHIVVLSLNDGSRISALQAYKAQISQHKGVMGASVSSHVPGQTTFKNPYLPEGFSREEIQWLGEVSADRDFLDVLGIELAAGRNFPSDTEAGTGGGVLINATAARLLGWEEAVGKTFRGETGGGLTPAIPVIGVVRDFHITSVRHAIEPLIIFNDPRRRGALSVKIGSEGLPDTLAYLEQTWEDMIPEQAFAYFFLDEGFDRQYRADERMGRIFASFTFLASFIACLGLFGLASFLAERRTQEIGIRKILGASTSGITVILTREFIKWVVLANVIAWPLAYYAGRHWLRGFAYRSSFGLDLFLLAAAVSLCIAAFTVGYQTLKAARANPADALRYE